MTAPHFFVESLDGDSLLLSVNDSHHALRSLRLRPGEDVTLSDGRGVSGRGRLLGEQAGRAAIAVDEVWNQATRSPVVSVALAPPKGDRLAWAVQKLAEIGVDEVVLIRSERSVRDWAPARGERASERLRAIAREAAMQSRQPSIMEVGGPSSLSDMVGSTSIMLWEGASTPLSSVLPEAPGAVQVLIGPEGGFTEGEVKEAEQAGASVASLGPNILRTETAALVGAALVLARYGRLG
jgi:16S rRNA (uracil1498-N3)-methyltransferase